MNTRKRSRASTEAAPEYDGTANESTSAPPSASKRPRRNPRPSLEATNTSRTWSTNGDFAPSRSPPKIRIKRSTIAPIKYDSEEGVSPRTITAGPGFLMTRSSSSPPLSPKQEPTIMSSDELAPPSSSPPPPHDTLLDVSTPNGEHPHLSTDKKDSLTTTTASKTSLQAQPLKLPQRGIFRPAQGVESAKDMKDDFADMGMSKKRARELAAVKETYTPEGRSIHKRASPTAADGREKRMKRDSKGKGPLYEGLQLGADPNWILFDPSHGYRDFLTAHNDLLRLRDPPSLFAQYEIYKPGNKRILEFNIHTHSVRLKTTPRVLQGKEVLFTVSGPRIVNLMELKKGRSKRNPRGTWGSKSRGSLVEVEEGEDEDSDEGPDAGELDEGEDELYT